MDAANGVGAIALTGLAKALGDKLSIEVVNDDTTTFSKLNFMVKNNCK